MKKTRIVLWFLIGAALGVAASVAVYFITQGDISWSEYVEQKLAPNAMLVGSALGIIGAALQPVLTQVKKSLTDFDSATTAVNQTAESSGAAVERISELERKVSNLEGIILEISDMLVEMDDNIKLGFGSMNELVQKGIAKKIRGSVSHEEKKS
ncbi:MAG: hypothetical protein IJX38_01285 [Clostridia bacterium]|nr:hypothetical protein [Clostridia bacterium]